MSAQQTDLKIALTLTAKSPENQISEFIEHHLQLGFDRIFIFFDDPDDPSFVQWQTHPNVRAFQCDSNHWQNTIGTERSQQQTTRQISNARYAYKLAHNDGIDWMTHIDSDELIYCKRDIKQMLKTVSEDRIKFKLLEAVPSEFEYKSIFSPTTFRVRPTPIRKKLARKICPRVWFYGHYFRAHIGSKVFIKVLPGIQNLEIHHAVDPKTEKVLKTAELNTLYLLHFDSIGLANWSMKFSRRTDPNIDGNDHDPKRSYLLKRYIDAAAKGSDAISSTYRDIYFISVWNRLLLRALKMLITIQR